MIPKTKIDKIGKWSEDKLKLLKKYLEAYTKILKGKEWCKGYYYVDAFAGTGKPQVKDEERFIDGSPLCALTIQNPFTKYYFIEKTKWRVKKLEKIKKEFQNLDIRIEEGDCNKILTQKIIPLLPYNSFKRALLFLDPFGMSVNWNVIEQASETKTIELILNMPIMAINRACLLNDPDKLTQKHIKRMNDFWGNSDWQNEIYQDMPTLFGTTKVKNRHFDTQWLSNYFVQRLKSVFSEVSLPLIMRNSKNAPLYCLIYAGHQKVAKEIIESIFNRFKKTKK
jgi:three-Cys-motif partner protein